LPALFFAPSRRNSPAKSEGLIVKNNKLQSPGKFACTSKSALRENQVASITIGAIPEFQFPQSTDLRGRVKIRALTKPKRDPLRAVPQSVRHSLSCPLSAGEDGTGNRKQERRHSIDCRLFDFARRDGRMR
jgi:hypothetical protein